MLNLIFQSIHKVKKLFKKNHLNFSGPFKSWDEAVINSSGYDSEIVLKKVSNAMREVLEGFKTYERDGTSFENKPVKNTIISILESENFKNSLIVDIGGGLGSLYVNYKNLFLNQNFNYHVIEQKKVCETGEQLNSEFNLNINYHTNLESIGKQVDIVICSSFLQYVKNWKGYIKNILSSKPKYIIIDRHPLKETNNGIFVQLNTGYYEKEVTYPIHILKTKEFLGEFINYEVVNSWSSDFDPEYFKGFLLKLKS